jgi:glycosyltransferase involved in cell wall biosynthesis
VESKQTHCEPWQLRERHARVYWLTETFYPPQIGGIELIVSSLSQGLAANGFDVHVITRKPEAGCPAQEPVGNVHVRRIEPAGVSKGTGWHALPSVLAFLGRLALLLVREARHYDILIISGMKIIPLAAIPVALLLGKRCVVRLESTAEIDEPISRQSLRSMNGAAVDLLQRLSAWIQRKMLVRADRVVAISDVLHQSLLGIGVPEWKISQIPNAIDLSRFHPVSWQQRNRLRAELGLPQEATVLLFAARLSRAKGIDLLVDAWPRIVAQHPELCLIIAGSGDVSFDRCEAEIEQSMRSTGLGGSHIRMVGATDRVHHYLQAADLYILPSEYEGFGIGVIEALATARPCLLTPVGVVPQLIRDGENGFLFPPRDLGAMMRAIDTALAARSRWPEIGDRGRRAVSSLDLPTVVQSYAQLCEDLTRRTQRSER